MASLGRREWVALALFAIALVIAGTFVNATASPDMAPRTPVLGEPLPAGPSAVPGSASPEPQAGAGAHHLTTPDAPWTLAYYTSSTNQLQRETRADTLDVVFDDVPFDLVAGDWHIDAVATFTLAPGQQTLTIEHSANVRIFVDGQELAHASSSGRPRTLSTVFQHSGGPAQIRIIAEERSGGGFVLRAR